MFHVEQKMDGGGDVVVGAAAAAAEEQTKPKGTLSDLMPGTAQVIESLRAQWGREYVDGILRRSKRGEISRAGGGAYFAEIGPDGVLREFGTPLGGLRAVLVDGKIEMRKEVKRAQ